MFLGGRGCPGEGAGYLRGQVVDQVRDTVEFGHLVLEGGVLLLLLLQVSAIGAPVQAGCFARPPRQQRACGPGHAPREVAELAVGLHLVLVELVHEPISASSPHRTSSLL